MRGRRRSCSRAREGAVACLRWGRGCGILGMAALVALRRHRGAIWSKRCEALGQLTGAVGGALYGGAIHRGAGAAVVLVGWD